MQETHFNRTTFCLSALLVSSFAAASAHAQEPPRAESASAEERAVVRPSPRPTGEGFGLGLDQGLFGSAFAQGLGVRIPILAPYAIAVRGMSAFGDRAGQTEWDAGGRLEFIGHSPVFLNLVRLYGGGGPEVLTRVTGGTGDKTVIGGGGQVGAEFFLGPAMSFFLEVGGHAGNALYGGATALGGIMFYPFTGS
jgi:hypothetical protein